MSPPARQPVAIAELPAPEPVTADPPAWTGRTIMSQQWAELAYFHWAYEPEVVQRLLPAGITVDTFDRRAWVGLIPFEMRRVRLGPTPPIPWLGDFIEINVRTYVTDALGRRGVWFLSLDVPRSPIVAVARTAFALPYCWAKARHERDGTTQRYTMARRWPRGSTAHAEMSYRVGAPFEDHEVGELEHFLSARWALLTRRQRQLLHGRVDHQRWPLHRVTDVEVHQNVLEAAGLPTPVGRPHAMYSPAVDVRIAWFSKVPEGGPPG